MRLLYAFTSLIAFFGFGSLAWAETEYNSDYLGVYAGYFDLTQDDNRAAQLGMEYRYHPVYKGLRPGVGFNVSSDESVYGYGGFFYDIPLSDSWILTPNVVAGGYSQGDGKDLGHGLQFRSGIELSYQFDGGGRLGLNFNHISNASIGDRNPGAETLFIMYQMPLYSGRESRSGYRDEADSARPRYWWEK